MDRSLLRAAERRASSESGRRLHLEPAGHGRVRVVDGFGEADFPEFTVRVSRRAGVREIVRRVLAGLSRTSALYRYPPSSFSSASSFAPYGATG